MQYTAVYCTILQYTAPYSATIHYTAPQHITLQHTAPQRTTHTTPQRTTAYHTAAYHSIPHDSVTQHTTLELPFWTGNYPSGRGTTLGVTKGERPSGGSRERNPREEEKEGMYI